MALEGLQAILAKEEVLATFKVRDLLDAPASVERKYLSHVRSYLPLGRVAGGNGQQSVTDYEKMLIAKVKQGAAPVGYLSAEYGYGKTSTAAFLWDRCRQANLLAVPPFQIERLTDLIAAAYGWGRYLLEQQRPALVRELEQLYRSYTERSISDDAGGDENYASRLAALEREGRYTVALNSADFTRFFEQYADLALRAGYQGVVLLPDELQQYTNPTINSSVGDPLSPLFELVNNLLTRTGYLKSTIIFVTPTKDLALIRDNRGDLVDRMQQHGLGFDLNDIYDASFAARLWQRLAAEFDFAAEAAAISSERALRALGEIAARHDLGSGPRTVVNGYKAMIRHYQADNQQPYSPLNLVDDFLSGGITFDGVSKLREEVNKLLRHPLVAGQGERERAVRYLAAFPSSGAPDAEIVAEGLREAVDVLIEQQLTITFGGRDQGGNLLAVGTTLRDLAPEEGGSRDWLTNATSQFIRLTYQEASEKAMERAANACCRLLRERIFREQDWKLVEAGEASSSRDAYLLLEGATKQTKSRYPQRRVYLRLISDGQPAASLTKEADLIITLDLRRHRDHSEAERRSLPGSIDTSDPRHLRLSLNLARQSSNQIYQPLQQTLEKIVSPNKVTPLLLLNLYAFLDEQLAANQVPKQDQPYVQGAFQNDLFDGVERELFNADLTAGRAGGVRILEDAYQKAIGTIYPDYQTLIGHVQYARAMGDYRLALEKLNPYQRRGEQSVSGTKEEIAGLFNRSNVGLDSLINDFPTLLRRDEDWHGRQQGSLSFTLHPWEQIVVGLFVSTGAEAGRKRRLPLADLRRDAQQRGYRDEEIEVLLALLAARGLAEVQGEGLVRQESKATTASDLRRLLDQHERRLTGLLAAFASDRTLLDQQAQVREFVAELARKRQVEDQQIYQIERTLKDYATALEGWRSQQQAAMRKAIRSLRPPVGVAEAERKLLERAYTGELAAQLEPLREQAAMKVELNSTRLAALHRDYSTLEAASSAIADEDELLKAQEQVAALRQQLERERSGDEQSRALIAQWRSVTTLLTEATALQSEIVAEGEAGVVAQGEYAAWLRGLREGLSVDRLRAFDQVSEWRVGLEGVRSRLAQARQAAEGQFATLQQAYWLALQQAGLAENEQPRALTYNRLDPAGSLRSLHELVVSCWQGLLNTLGSTNKRLDSEVQQMQSAADPDMERNHRSRLLEQCAALGQQLAAHNQQLVALYQAAEQLAAAGPAALRGAASSLRAASQTLERLRVAVAEVRASFSQLSLSEGERTLLAGLRALAGGPSGVELAALLRQSEGKANRQQVWIDLAGLYDKLRLRVRLEVIEEQE